MKKFLLLLFLMTFSLGQSQSLTGTWKVTSIGVGASRGQTNYFSLNNSSGLRACFFDDEYVFSANGTFQNVQGSETWVEDWQGGSNSCGTPVAPHNGSNAATYSSTATTLTLTGVGAYLGLAKVTTDSELTSPSNAPASVTYLITSLTSSTLIVDVALSNGAWWRFALSNGVALPTAPTVAAPTPVTRNSFDVVSVFSGAYSNVGLNELPTSWSGISSFTPLQIQGNDTWNVTGCDFLGIVTNYDSGINLSNMTKMHIDYWTPDDNAIGVKIVNTVSGGEAIASLGTTVTGSWQSIDVDFSAFAALSNKTTITQILIDVFGVSTLYIDNFYFYRPATSGPSPTITGFANINKFVGDSSFALTAPTSNSNGALTYTSSNTSVATISGTTVTIVGAGTTTITATQAASGAYGSGVITATLTVSFAPPVTAAPTPTVRADRVLSVFSDAYTNEGGASYPYWGQPAGYTAPAVVQIGTPGNSTLKIENLSYQGVQLTSNIDVSSMTTLHLDIWTPNCTTFEFALIDSAPVGVPPAEQAVSVTPTQSGWNSIDIPLASYNTLALTGVQQFKFVGTPFGASTVYLDNIYFTKPTPTNVAPTTAAVINLCKGAVATRLTATGFAGNTLKWYTGTTSATTGLTTYGTASATAPTPLTTIVGTKYYQVSQLLSSGVESAKATITVNVIALPTTPGTIAGTAVQGPLVGTTTTATYSIVEVTGATSYTWTAPTGVNIMSGQGTNSITVNFNNVSAGAGAIGNLSVVSVNSNGCLSIAKTLALTKAIPTASATLTMTDGVTTTAITSFAKYMGTSTVLTLTASASTTATSYVWELPIGVNLVSGATVRSGVTSGTSNVITVNFLGVTSDNTFNYTTTAAVPVSTNVLRIGVKSRNGVGVSTTSNSLLANPTTTSTAKLLTLTAVAPAAPAAIKMTDNLISSSTAVTVVSKYIGTDRVLTLTATPSVLASSYIWELPGGARQLSGGNTNVITVDLLLVDQGITSLYFGVKANNGVGISATNNTALVAPDYIKYSTSKYLKVTATVPAGVASVSGQLVSLCGGLYNPYTYTMTASPLATSYLITAPEGAIVSVNNYGGGNVLTTSDLTFQVTYPEGFTITTATAAANKSIVITAVNGVGNSTNKVLALTTAVGTVGANTNSYVNPLNGATNVTLFGKCAPQTFTVPAVPYALGYSWMLPNGASGFSNTNSIVIDFANVSTPTPTTKIILKVRASNGCTFSAEKSITLTYDGVTFCPGFKTATPSVTTAVSIYPNPARDNFNVEIAASEVSEMSMTIYNMNGAIVRTKNVQLSEGNNVINEDISSLASGIYFVRFNNPTNNETITKKLVKE